MSSLLDYYNQHPHQRSNPKKNMVYGTLCGVDYKYNLTFTSHLPWTTLCPRADLNPMPESTLSPQSGTLDLVSPSMRVVPLTNYAKTTWH
jgi:hypothetical protein